MAALVAGMKRQPSVPVGRIDGLRARPDAALLAVTYPRSGWNDCTVTLYKSRAALECFCKDGSLHHAVIKTPTHQTMITNRNTQQAARETGYVS